MKSIKNFLLLAFLCSMSTLMVQAQSVGINTSTPDTTAVLDVVSTTKGMLIPRMNSGQRTGIADPALGLLVFDTDTESFWYHQSNGWFELTNGTFTNDSGVVRSTGNHGTDDFVFGSVSLPPASAISDTLIFFDKSKGAFRFGILDNSKAWASDSIGGFSFSSGYNTVASGILSVALGYETRATGDGAIATGQNSQTAGDYAMATGLNTRASGAFSFTSGSNSIASGSKSFATGNNTIASNQAAVASGSATEANGYASFATGNYAQADALSSFASGQYNVGGGSNNAWVPTDPIFEIGIGETDMTRINAMTVLKNGDFIVGNENVPPATPIMDSLLFYDKSKGAFRSGLLYNSDAWAPDSIGRFSFSSGYNTVASGILSVALGYETRATGDGAIATGQNSQTTGDYAMATGLNTRASGAFSFATGSNSIASGSKSFATGNNTIASNQAAVASGSATEANGYASFATGNYAQADALASFSLGQYNVGGGSNNAWIPTDPIFEIGIGETDMTRINAVTVLKNGDFIVGNENVPPATPIMDSLMFYDKSKGAFRSGLLYNSDAWAPDSIGRFSFSSGYNTVASGILSVALGYETRATGDGAIATGQNSQTTGDYAMATGLNTRASGAFSFATGSNSIASGSKSIATGNNTIASNQAAVASGSATEANGYASFATGNYTHADALASFSLGQYNVGGGSNNSWITSDPVLEVGIGTSEGNRKNAVTVLKNGDFIVGREDVPPASIITDTLLFFDKSKGAFRTGALFNSAVWGSNAIGSYSFSAGYNTLASGLYAVALGHQTEATGVNSTALGTSSKATGFYALATGRYTKAEAYASTAHGQYNVGEGTTNSWVTTDPIFEVGIGSNDLNRKNAMTILKNGLVGIGTITPVAPLEIFSNGNATTPQLKLTESAANDGARIIFSNGVETDNRWTMFGLADNTHDNSFFNVFYNGIGNIITASGLGYVGIKCDPESDLHIRHGNSGSTSGLKLQNVTNNEYARLYVSSGDGNLRLYFDTTGLKGTFNDVNGVYSTVSDRRLKNNFQPLDFDWNSFNQLTPLTYTYKNDDESKRYIGMIAQDVNEIYPQLITYVQEDDRYTMDYAGFGIIAIKAIQEQQKTINDLRDENKSLEARLAEVENKNQKNIDLEARLAALENLMAKE